MINHRLFIYLPAHFQSSKSFDQCLAGHDKKLPAETNSPKPLFAIAIPLGEQSNPEVHNEAVFNRPLGFLRPCRGPWWTRNT